MEYFEKDRQADYTDSETTDSELDKKKLTAAFLSSEKTCHPKFEITSKRKFEVSEMCEVFISKYVKFVYLAILSVYGFMANWTFSTVAGSAWALNIPFHHFANLEMCREDAFLHNVLPSGTGCLYAYYFSLSLFAIVVVTLSMFDLKEQAVVQLILGLLRFITVAALVLFCLVRVIQGGDACVEELGMSNLTTDSHINVGIGATVAKFDPRGWLVAIPVFTFAFLFHTGISSLTHPIKQKQYLHWLILAMFLASTVCYLSLGFMVPLWFRASIQETCTLNWVSFFLFLLFLFFNQFHPPLPFFVIPKSLVCNQLEELYVSFSTYTQVLYNHESRLDKLT